MSFVLALGAVAAIFHFRARGLYDYAVTPAALEVRLFRRLPIYRIALTDIVDVRPWQLGLPNIGVAFSTLRLGNRIFGPAVVIERHDGFPRYIVITPDDAKEIVAKLRAY